MARTAAPAPPAAEDRSGGATDRRVPSRLVYLDNLKVLVVALVIVWHGTASYAAQDWWSYAAVREVELSDVGLAVVLAVMGPFELVLMPLLFLTAGLVSVGSVARRGPGRFAAGRLLRLGVPFVVVAMLLWPLTVQALHRAVGDVDGASWERVRPDHGSLWFAAVLLLLSLAYAGWVRLRGGSGGRAPRPVTLAHLLLLALVVVVATYPVRQRWPLGSATPLDLNEWQWPACAALYGLGTVGAGQGWLQGVPPRLERSARRGTAVAGLALAGLLGLAVARGAQPTDVLGVAHWSGVVLLTGEAVVAVLGSVWLVGVAQRSLAGSLPHGELLARSAYGAFVVGGFVVLGLAFVLRPLDLPAEVKAVLVATTGVAGSYALAHVLLARVPVLRRVLL